MAAALAGLGRGRRRASELGGRLVAVGGDGRGSELLLMDVTSGAARRAALPVPFGHSIVIAGTETLVCLPRNGRQAAVVDARTLTVRHTLEAPSGYVFEGHGVFDATTGLLAVALARREARSAADTGLIRLFRAPTMAVHGEAPSGGVQPHDLALTPDGTSLVVTHYGQIGPLFADGIHDYRGTDAKVAWLAWPDLTLKRTLADTGHGALTHCTIDHEGWLHVVPLQYASSSPKGLAACQEAVSDAKLVPGIADVQEKAYGMPAPLLSLAPDDAAFRVVIPRPSRQRRPQSLAVASDGQVYVTFANCNMLMRHDPRTGATDFADLALFGVTTPRGVAVLGATAEIAVSFDQGGILLLDRETFAYNRLLAAAPSNAAHLTHLVT